MEEILDYLKEDTLTGFFIRALQGSVSVRLNVKIRRQRCLFHMEKDLAHKIADAKMEDHLDMAKRLIKYMFFQNKANIDKLGMNKYAVEKITEGMNEIVKIMLEKINSLYGDDKIIESFLTFVKNHRKEVFLYLQDPKVEKTSDKAEQHFSIQSWLLKHRFKTKEGLIRTSHWYHRCLSTGM